MCLKKKNRVGCSEKVDYNSCQRQKQLIKKLEEYKFNVVTARMRHMYTMGGGLHCATLDTVRESKLESYF